VVVLVNAMYPALFMTTGSISSVSSLANDRAKSEVRVVMANSPNTTALQVWVKNTGSIRVPDSRINYTDVYFGDKGSMARASPNPSTGLWWAYSLDDADGNGHWDTGETLEMTIYDPGATRFTAGDHQIKLVLYNAASFENTLTI
jgi:flagellar protein FlaG